MAAKRIENMSQLDASQISYWKDENGWWVYLPGCGAGRISKHSVEEHDDGTITVSPSILMHGHRHGEPTTKHGYLEHGEWRDF